MENLEVTKENAVKAYNEGNDKQKALLINLFGKKHFLKNISTWEDVLEYHNISIKAFDSQYKVLDEQGYANEQVKLIVSALNEGWQVEPFNTSQYKYYPWFEVKNGSFVYYGYNFWDSRTYVGSRLCFKSSELAQFAGKTFIDIYTKLLS